MMNPVETILGFFLLGGFVVVYLLNRSTKRVVRYETVDDDDIEHILLNILDIVDHYKEIDTDIIYRFCREQYVFNRMGWYLKSDKFRKKFNCRGWYDVHISYNDNRSIKAIKITRTKVHPDPWRPV